MYYLFMKQNLEQNGEVQLRWMTAVDCQHYSLTFDLFVFVLYFLA